jgi:hypothetical protein
MVSNFLDYYSRSDVQKGIYENCKDKEIAVQLGERGFARRPNIIQYDGEILDFVKDGGTSFHISEETWGDPLSLAPGMPKKKLDPLRIGWDLVLDIDSPDLEDSKIIAHYLVEAMKFHDVKSIFVKYSGNKGFHIVVPFEAFPIEVNNILIKDQFPEGPKVITEYLTNMIKKPLFEEFKERTNEVLKIDTVLISSRHMYRAPYSLHEKSGLVSLPVDPSNLLSFDKNSANPKTVKFDVGFLENREKITERDASKLMMQAFDWHSRIKNIRSAREEYVETIKGPKNYEEFKDTVPEKFFPESIKKGLTGLEDGKKRFLFVLINFLKCVGWNFEDIDKKVREWNSANPEPLREGYLLSQLNWHKRQKEKILPPNYDNNNYYRDLQIPDPDHIMKKFKNPVNYAILMYKRSKK